VNITGGGKEWGMAKIKMSQPGISALKVGKPNPSHGLYSKPNKEFLNNMQPA